MPIRHHSILCWNWAWGGWLLCMAWAYSLCKYRHTETWGGAIAFTVYAQFNTITMSTPHLLAGLLIIITLSTKPVTNIPLSRSNSRYVAWAVLLVLVLPSTVFYAYTTYKPSRQLAQARSYSIHDIEDLDTMLAYQKAISHPWAYPQSHAEYGYILLRHAPDKAKLHLEKAMYALDTGELHLALSQQYLHQGNRQLAAHFAESGVYRWPRYTPGWELWLKSAPPEQRDSILKQSKKWGQSLSSNPPESP